MKIYIATCFDYSESAIFGVYKTFDKALEDSRAYLMQIYPDGKIDETVYDDYAYLRMYSWEITIEKHEVKE